MIVNKHASMPNDLFITYENDKMNKRNKIFGIISTERIFS